MQKLSKGERMNASQMTEENTVKQRMNEWNSQRFNFLNKSRLIRTNNNEIIIMFKSKLTTLLYSNQENSSILRIIIRSVERLVWKTARLHLSVYQANSFISLSPTFNGLGKIFWYRSSFSSFFYFLTLYLQNNRQQFFMSKARINTFQSQLFYRYRTFEQFGGTVYHFNHLIFLIYLKLALVVYKEQYTKKNK